MNKTRTFNQNDIAEEWYLIDAKGLRIGKLASKVAELLMAKHNPKMRSYLSPKTKVIVTNAAELDIPAKKHLGKVYTAYSGYPGGLRIETLAEVKEKDPTRIIEHAIKGMLPHTRRTDAIMASNLYIYAGADHKHQAQNPTNLDITNEKF